MPKMSPKPSTFVDDLPDVPDLSVMSLEAVVARFKDTEKQRNTRSEPDPQAEVHWKLRRAPSELVSSINVVASRMGVTRSVLTKCMSRHAAEWYRNALDIAGLSTEYKNIYAEIKMRAYRTLRVQAENPSLFSFAFSPEPTNVSISTIQWVLSELGSVREIVGVYAIDLLLAGFCWSLTTLENRDWDRQNIERFFIPESENMMLLVGDRWDDVTALKSKFQRREKTYECTKNH